METIQYRLILGSQSPRRRELMATLGFPFTSVDIDVDESFPSHLQAGEIPAYLAKKKAEAYLPQLKEKELLITADTIVWANGMMLGKPIDTHDAARMLRLLSGTTHQVYTAVCLTTSPLQLPHEGESECLNSDNTITFIDRTDVTFRALSEEEIDYYISHYKPMDKAGAYGIQEWIGAVACTRLDGSYFNVMGFPTHLVYEAVHSF